MASLNKVILIGRLGKDPEITTFESGNKKMVDQTEWHNLVAWGNLANDIADKRRNYAKGDMMYVEGRLRTRQYTDNQGINRYVTEIQVDKLMQLVSAHQATQSSYGTAPQAAQEPVYQAPAAANDPFANQQMPSDDLPF